MSRPFAAVLVALLAVAPLASADIAPARPAVAPAAAPGKITVKKLAPLTVGLAGYAGAEAARADSDAIQRFLSAKLNREVTTRIFPTADALAEAVATGAVDLAWMQPFSVVQAQAKGKVTPLLKAVRHGLPFYRGVLFAKAGTKLGELPEKGRLGHLQGTKVGWVNATSAAGYLFPRAALVSAGLVPAKTFAKEEFLGDHAAVCKAVLDGKVDVGATFADDRPAGEKAAVDGCVQSLGAEAASALRIVATSAPIPNDAIVARPGLEAADADKVRAAFLGAANEVDGKVLLMSVFKAEGFVEVGAEDFEPVRFAAEAGAR